MRTTILAAACLLIVLLAVEARAQGFQGGIRGAVTDPVGVGVDSYIPGDGAGFFDFDKDMTSSTGGVAGTTDGNSFASFLLGYPSSQSARESRLSVSTPLNVYAYDCGGYVQDDWRVSPKLTLN